MKKKKPAANKISKELGFESHSKKHDQVKKACALVSGQLFKFPALALDSCACLGKQLTFSEPSFCSAK